MSKKEITWDLTAMFSSPNDPAIEKKIREIQKKTESFVEKYQGNINKKNFGVKEIKELLDELARIQKELETVESFGSLSFAADMTVPENQKLYNRVEEAGSELDKKLTFVDLELGKRVYKKKELVADHALGEYKHYLEILLRRVPHLLSEQEEQLVIEKDQHGVEAWSQLQSQWLNTRTFEVEVEGKRKKLSYGEANSLLDHPDRKTRESAYRSIYTGLGEDKLLYASALRGIVADWMKVVKRRKYERPVGQALIANDISYETLENLMNTVEQNTALYQRYLTIKAKLMDLEKLACWDIVAPLPNASKENISYKKAKKLVIEAYEDFDEKYASAVKEMFAKNHIDASIRMGKRNGAFCSPWYEGTTSLVLLSYGESIGDLYTLAHELGHATHNYYAQRAQPYLTVHSGMIMAETASIFGELLMTENLLKKAKTKEKKQAVLTHVLDGAGMAIFQVSARFWFEKSMYEALEKGEFLDGETQAKYWVKRRDKVYGDSVEWFDAMKWEYAMKPHYYMPNFRYYNFPYVGAQLLVWSLYQIYKKEGKEFVPTLKKILSAGGSKSPEELVSLAGFDLTEPEFWQLGMRQYKEFVDLLEETL
ncbi:MAG: M3 family oligoendopeptidase [Euryarchaeota archaeon]|nr:M3 family oligoendopeptidase [Euryarchaeota archaeon]